MRILLVAIIAVSASPALADFDDLAARIAHTHSLAESARQGAREARADKLKKESAAIDAKCAKLGGANIGMDAAAIQKSCWGKPRKINETITARGKHEQWVYDGGYLYLDDGLVTSIQTSR